MGVRIRNAYFRLRQIEPDNDNSTEIRVRQDLQNDKTCTLSGTTQEDFPEILPHTDDRGDGTDTDHYMEPHAETSSEQLSPTDINPRSTKSDLRHNLKPKCNDDYRY